MMGLSIWFEEALGDKLKDGALTYSVFRGEVWATLAIDRTFPDDSGAESKEIIAQYGASVGGLGDMLLDAGVPLPSELESWASARSVPADQLGGWRPEVIKIDGLAYLAYARDFDTVTAHATTFEDMHLFAFAPTRLPSISLNRG